VRAVLDQHDLIAGCEVALRFDVHREIIATLSHGGARSSGGVVVRECSVSR
jgi:hypothetical protein